MREAARFLETMSDILDIAMAEGMDSRGLPLLLAAARKDVETVRLADPAAHFEIGDGDVFWRGRPLAGTAEWDWRERLLAAGVRTLSPPDDEAAFEAWVERLTARLGRAEPAGSTQAAHAALANSPPAVSSPPSAGSPTSAIVESSDPPEAPPPPPAPEAERIEVMESSSPPGRDDPARREPPPDAPRLDAEAERVWWLYGEAANRGQVPRRESEALVDTLYRLPARGPAFAEARPLDDGGELTTAHLVNVALLAMGVGRHLAFDGDEIRALGLAAIYHDVGRVRVDGDRSGPSDLEAHRRMVQGHPEAGARVLMDSGRWFAVAAVVAYEHHLTWRGTGGYPPLHFARPPHQFTRIITVCDTYDALRTERAYRNALSADATTDYLRMLAGKTLDPEIVTGVVGYLTSTDVTQIVHDRTRPEAALGELKWLPDTGFDPDCEPRPISI